MAHWNHRVVKKKYDNGEEEYAIHECHYNDDGSIYGYTIVAIPAHAESIEGLREVLGWMLNCLDKPILVDGEVEFVNPYKDEDFEEGSLEELDALAKEAMEEDEENG